MNAAADDSRLWHAFFLPQRFSALRPGFLDRTNGLPAVILAGDRAAARNPAAVRAGIDGLMSGREALCRAPALQIARADFSEIRDLSALIRMIGWAAGAPSCFLEDPRSGAAALMVRGARRPERITALLGDLAVSVFPAASPDPKAALLEASHAAEAAGALLSRWELMPDGGEAALIRLLSDCPENFELRLSLAAPDPSAAAQRLSSALSAWMQGRNLLRARWSLSALGTDGLPLRPQLRREGETGKSAEDLSRLRLQLAAQLSNAGASGVLLRTEAIPAKEQSLTPEEEQSPLTAALAAITGSERVFQLAATGAPLPEDAQLRIPALHIRGSAHQRAPMASARPGILPAEILSDAGASLPSAALLRSLRIEGDAQRIEDAAMGIARDYFAARTPSGERLWIFRDLPAGQWHIQGRFA